MGQYHAIYNLDRQESLNPCGFGDGLKLREFGMSGGGTMAALAYLLAGSTCRGGGDFAKGPNGGRWCGDKIAIIGDYCEDGDVRGTTMAELKLGNFTDITGEVRNEMGGELDR